MQKWLDPDIAKRVEVPRQPPEMGAVYFAQNALLEEEQRSQLNGQSFHAERLFDGQRFHNDVYFQSVNGKVQLLMHPPATLSPNFLGS